ncbi:MAG TPA: hypothetical protein VLC47_03815 [Burkholderiales bacterium]|nr:hypothetical protein [Burkholderiales bacterium]
MIYVLLLGLLALGALALDFFEVAQALGIAALGVLLFSLTRGELDSSR